MDSQSFTILALFILVFSLISGRLEKSVITGPMVFVLFGFLASPKMFGFVTLHAESEVVRILAEFTLIVVLFVDAASIDFKTLKKQFHLPLRMLVIGMPITIAFGAVLTAFWFPNFSFFEAAALAAILAPTDAALGQVVVSDKRMPMRLRQGLSVESGLNDGIALPIVLIFLAIGEVGGQNQSTQYWFDFTAKQVLLAPLVGIGVGYIGGKLLERTNINQWMNHSFAQISGVALALLSYGLSEFVGGNGFIAAFVAGLTLGNSTKAVCACLYEFSEAEGQLLGLFTFFIFGNILLVEYVDHINIKVIGYAILSLTIIRMFPVAISLVGLNLKWQTHVLLGWFGPRGLASILFGLIVLERVAIVHHQEMVTVIITTVLLSIIAHGFSAYPAVGLYTKYVKEKEAEAEFVPVTMMPSEKSQGPSHPILK